MTTLTRASRELFKRGPDETFQTLEELEQHCLRDRDNSTDVWQLPQTLMPQLHGGAMTLTLEKRGEIGLNDWSFTQLCRLAGISKETINRFTPETAVRAFQDTLPAGEKPIQLLTTDAAVRSVHRISYTRLWNAELIETVRDAAPDFQPPPDRLQRRHGAVLR